MSGNADERLFPINGDPFRDFYTGALPAGRQALIALFVGRRIVAAVFDCKGVLQQVIHQDLPSPPVISVFAYGCELDEEQLAEYLKEQFGFSPGPIRVREFRLAGGELALYRLPERYQKFLKNPSDPDFDMEERLALPAWIEEWERDGHFVLEIAPCDYWLDQTGEVIAS